MTQLCRIEVIAKELGIPKSSLRTAAEKHGFLVRMGRAIRLERDRIPELLKKCRDQPKEPGSTNSNTDRTSTSGTQANPTAARAAQAAQKLKKRSGPTSQPKGGQVLPLSRKTTPAEKH